MDAYTLDDLVLICRITLFRSRDILRGLGKSGKEEVKDRQVYDISTKGDMSIAHQVRDLLRNDRIPAFFCDEELGVEKLVQDPRCTIVFDDIDGTNNYNRGQGTMPYCTAVAVFDKPLKDCAYKDVAVAGVLEHRTGLVWLAARGRACQELEYVYVLRNALGGYLDSHGAVHTSNQKELEKRKTVVAIEGYESGRQIVRFADIFEQAWVKDMSTSAIELAGVACGIFDAFIHPRHKKDELPAGYLLIKEAGGCITDFAGEPLDNKQYVYDANARQDIVAAATPELNEKLRKLIRPIA